MAQCAGATQAQPVLRLLSVDGGMLRLGWPASLSGGFVVERSATAVVGSWTRASGAGVSGVIVGGEVETTQGIVSMPIEFFRLRSTQPDEPLVLVVRMAGSGALDAGLLSGLAAGAVILPGTNFADVLAAVPAAGATVLLDDGVFGGGVVVPARVTLRGRGPDRTRIVVAAGESRPALMVAGDDVTIEGVTLERLAGSGAALVAVTAERAALRNNVFISSASGLPLVNATAGSGHRVESNRFESVISMVGVLLASGSGHRVATNVFRAPGSAVVLQGGASTVEKNDFRNPGGAATALVRLEGVTASGNVVSNNLLVSPGGVTVALATGAVGNRVEANRLVPGDVLVETSAGSGNIVVNNALRTLVAVSVVPPPWVGEIVGGVALETTNGVPTLWTGTLTNAVALIGSSGADVELGEGVFTGNVQLTSGVVLRGLGWGRTKVVPLTPEQLPAVRVVGSGVTIEDLELDGQRDASPATTNDFGEINGVITVAGADAVLRRVRVANSLGNGVLATLGGSGMRIENCLILNTATNNTPAGTIGGHGYGIFCSRSPNVIVRSNVISGWAQGVGLWWGVTNGLVEHNRIVDNFGFIDAAHLINRSACEDYGADVVPHGANLWRSNLVDGSTSHCLEIAQGVAGSRFIGNVLRRPGQISNYGQHFEVTGQPGIETYDILVEGNDILSEGLRADECSVNGLASRVVVSNNIFSGFAHPASNGPLFLGGLSGVRDVTIVSNTFVGSRFGVWVNADTTGFVIHGNLFTNPQRSDAVIHVASSGRGQVTGNLLTGTNFVAGIKLMGTGGNLISGNTVTLPAPALNCSSADNVVTNNTFTETTASLAGAIRLEGLGALRNRVTGNVVGSPDSRAILLLQGAADNIVTNNFITSGYVEVHPTAGLGNLVSGN